MDFKIFINESSLNDLHQSSVGAFPDTRMRQHATQPIEITEFNVTPYLGVRTLFLRARATNEDRHYSPMILFKGVQYHENQDVQGLAQIELGGRNYFFEQLSLENNHVMLRCDCNDFKWRFNYYDYTDGSLHGRVRAPYHGQGGAPANPHEMPGMCKHLMKMTEVLTEMGMIR